MMIMVSKDRWLGTPEAVYQVEKSHCEHPESVEHKDHVPAGIMFWVARMPSGALEQLTDDEWEQLNKLV